MKRYPIPELYGYSVTADGEVWKDERATVHATGKAGLVKARKMTRCGRNRDYVYIKAHFYNWRKLVESVLAGKQFKISDSYVNVKGYQTLSQAEWRERVSQHKYDHDQEN